MVLIITQRRWLVRRAECWYEVTPQHPHADIVEYLHLEAPLQHSRTDVFETIVLDLTRAEAELFAEMNKTTRNEIRRASQEGLQYQVRVPDRRAISELCAFYERHHVWDGAKGAGRWCRSHLKCGTLDLSQVAHPDGTVLVWHVYYRDQRHARLKYSVSLSRETNITMRSMIGRANRYHHWEDIRRFQSEGLDIYDLGGHYRGTSDEKLLRINRFKEGLGGRITTCFHCTVPLTVPGRLYLWAADRRKQWKTSGSTTPERIPVPTTGDNII